jgi:hypothetical protein
MNRQRKNWFAPAALLGTAMALSAACGSVSERGHARRDPNEGVAQNTASIVITAATIDKLAPGERLTVDLRLATVYTFDYANRPIDWSRISLITERGESMTMDKWLTGFSSTVNKNYGATLPSAQLRLLGKGTHADHAAAPQSSPDKTPYITWFVSDDGHLVLMCEYDDYTNELIYCDVYTM